MPSLDAWLEIRAQAWFVLFLLLLLFLLLSGGALTCWRLWNRANKLSNQARDLRARTEVDGEREAQQDSAREAYRHFIYNLSHEVSNPLQSIQVNLDNMDSYLPDDIGRWRQIHAIISAELRQLASLTENLRLLSHLETPDAPMISEPVNLKRVVDDVIMALFERAEAQNVQLRYVGPGRPARVLGDRGRLRQVLINLVDNGIKYSKPEGGEVNISVQEVQDRLRVRVSDEGIGIAEEDLPYIFDSAYRAPDALSFRRRGSGLGLAIVKRIVEQHGGEVRVQSRPGEGTTFSFDLPLYIPS